MQVPVMRRDMGLTAGARGRRVLGEGAAGEAESHEDGDGEAL
jgi:hypothetical protein